MLTPGAGTTAQVADLVMSPEEIAELISELRRLHDELDVESLPQAALEPVAWGTEFEETGRLNTAYVNAQRVQHETAERLRADAAQLIAKLEATRDDLDAVDEESARQFQARAAERLEGAGRADRTRAGQQQVREELTRQQPGSGPGGG